MVEKRLSVPVNGDFPLIRLAQPGVASRVISRRHGLRDGVEATVPIVVTHIPSVPATEPARQLHLADPAAGWIRVELLHEVALLLGSLLKSCCARGGPGSRGERRFAATAEILACGVDPRLSRPIYHVGVIATIRSRLTTT